MRGRILLVEDDASLRETLCDGLREDGFEVSCAASAEEALRFLSRSRPEALVTDLRMKGMSGLELCRRARELDPRLPVVVMTAFGDMEAAVEAIRAGAYDFLAKPFEAEALTISLDRAVQNRRLQREIEGLQQRLREARPVGSLIGDSPELLELADLIDRAAQSDATVLVTGETGSGKELVARALHERSARRGRPFVAINCAAVPEALLESELFGHVRGAFTDARRDRRGLFQQAEGGTLFLDEIGDMPLPLQAKLLRVLQERRVRPVGSDSEQAVDVRVVAATHRDLEEAVEEGTFRRDLLYRINVIHIAVPPLRERGNDVLLLAQHFLREHAERSGRPVRGISTEAAAKLLAYDWPGNVRELENCIERAVALTRNEEIGVEDLPERVRDWAPPPDLDVSEGELLPLEEVERRHILRVLEAVGGNKARAANVLGIGRKTLYRKLERYRARAASKAAEG
ncbi:MAG: sigma-54-dependent Fis family transcriptional regulator [Planctomycetota bacterium]|nr:MAG: sigma-54-dependent Fis family transcriptional regulator [Planctomycetota bacterium]